jgi:hypothetical protein
VKLGFQFLDKLLRTIRDVVSSHTDYTGDFLYVKAMSLTGSAHINELVQGQRKAKKKKPAAKSYSLAYMQCSNLSESLMLPHHAMSTGITILQDATETPV